MQMLQRKSLDGTQSFDARITVRTQGCGPLAGSGGQASGVPGAAVFEQCKNISVNFTKIRPPAAVEPGEIVLGIPEVPNRTDIYPFSLTIQCTLH